MPPRLSDRAVLVTDPSFTARVAMGAVTVALAVIGEPEDAANRPLRVNFASAVLADPLKQGARLTAVVLASESVATLALSKNPNAQASEELDTAVMARLRETWDALSGVSVPAATMSNMMQ